MAGKVSVIAPRQFEATHRGYRQSAQKARLVMDLIRGKNVVEALNTLRFTPNRAAPHVAKVIRSAIANAENLSNKDSLGIDAESLVITEARVDKAFQFRRFRPRSRGMANPILRRFCHLHVKLGRPQDAEALKLFRTIVSQKRRVDRIKDLKGLEKAGDTTAAKPEAKAEAKAVASTEKKAEAKAEPKAAKAKKTGKE